MFIVSCSDDDESDAVVFTHQQAFDFMKREVLARHMDKLKSVGADASIFEDVDMDVGDDWPCNKPMRYSSAYRTEFGGIHVKLFENRKGHCADCWDLIKVDAEVVDKNKVYDLNVEKRPSWRRSIREDGTSRKPGDEGEQCGPVKVKPDYVRKSPRSP